MDRVPGKRTRGPAGGRSVGVGQRPRDASLDTRQATGPAAGAAGRAEAFLTVSREGEGARTLRIRDLDPKDLDLILALPPTSSRRPGSAPETSLRTPRDGARRREGRGGSSRRGPGRCGPGRLALATRALPGSAGSGPPPAHRPVRASVGPRLLGRLPAAPGRPLRTPGAGGVAAARGPRGHAGDAGGGLAAAPRRRQRGPDLPEAPDGRPQQVRSRSASCWAARGLQMLGRPHEGAEEEGLPPWRRALGEGERGGTSLEPRRARRALGVRLAAWGVQ